MKLLSLLSAALGLSTEVQRAPSQRAIPEPTVTVNALIGEVHPPSRRLWVSTFDRAEHRQGKRFRSQKERSNRRKASR